MYRNFAKEIKKVLSLQRSKFYFGFVNGDSFYSKNEIKNIKLLLKKESRDDIRGKFENKFSSIIGEGFSLSFASGRMAFYTLLKTFDIGEGDEILVTGFTCSVMLNAIFKVGAIPVYVDIDPNTLGTSSQDLVKKITPKTKLIVAQHSFGIPCDIINISKIAKEKNIYLVEDCALAISSKISGINVGNFGDAAIFSTDHSKPINTLIGGVLYTKDLNLYNLIKENFYTINELNSAHQKRLFKRFLFERKYFNPILYKRTKFIELYRNIERKLFFKKKKIVFLENEESPNSFENSKKDYPYPALLPEFLAYIGLKEVIKWELEVKRRKKLLSKFLDIVIKENKNIKIPHAYFNKKLEIVPHRFIMFSDNKERFIKKAMNKLDVSWFWFEKPIVTTDCNLSKFRYRLGDCKNSEIIGKKIINFPTNVSKKYEDLLLDFFKSIIKYV